MSIIKTMPIPLDPRSDKQDPMITNTMKQYCIGEFEFTVSSECGGCLENGADDDCDVCGGGIVYQQAVTVPWNTCKKIYKQMATMANASPEVQS